MIRFFSTALGLLGVLLCAVAAWLFLPREASGAGRPTVVTVALVDASASARRTRPGWLPWVRRTLRSESVAAGERGELFAVVSFAADVGASYRTGSPEEFLARLEGRAGPPFDPLTVAGPDDASHLADALEVTAGLCAGPRRLPGRVILLGTGDYTGSDPLGALAGLRRRGARFARSSPPPPQLSDLALRDVRMPRTIEPDAELVAVVRLALERGRRPVTSARLDADVELDGVVTRASFPLVLPAEGGEWELPLPLGPAGFGRTEVRLRVRLSPGPDPVPENDAARAACVAGGERVVGVVARADRLSAAEQWLAPSGSSALPGLSFVFMERDALPAQLGDLDALVSFDVTPRDLPEALLEDFVRKGGGWLATSGWRFLEDWVPGEAEAGLHAVLPVAPAPLDHGPRDVFLLVDGSGSMEGAPFETVRAASLDLVAAALPSDAVYLRFFTGRLEEAQLIKPRTSSADADARTTTAATRRLLSLRVPNGETYILRSLERLAAERVDAAHEALVLLLTDGREREGMPDPEVRAERVRTTLAGTRTELRVVAIGKDADHEFLGLLTRPGEEVLRPESLADLAAIFRREISGAQWREGEALSVDRRPAGAESLAREIRGAGASSALPPLARFVRNVVRPTAEVLWQAEETAPILAVQRVGRGRTAVFASSPEDGWAPAWTGHVGPGEPRVFENLLRWLARGERDPDDEPLVRVVGERLVLTNLVDAPTVVQAQVFDGRSRGAAPLAELRLEPPLELPGGDPMARREARLPAELARELRGCEPVLRVHAGPRTAFLALDLGLPEEFSGGAEVLDPGSGAGSSSAPRPREAPSTAHPAGVRLLLLGLSLLFLCALGRAAGQGIPAFGR